MGIWHNWAVYQRAQVIYGAAIVEREGVKDGVNGGKSDTQPVLLVQTSQMNLKPGPLPHGLDHSNSQSDTHVSCYNGSNSAFPTFWLMDSGAANALDLLWIQPPCVCDTCNSGHSQQHQNPTRALANPPSHHWA